MCVTKKLHYLVKYVVCYLEQQQHSKIGKGNRQMIQGTTPYYSEEISSIRKSPGSRHFVQNNKRDELMI